MTLLVLNEVGVAGTECDAGLNMDIRGGLYEIDKN